jgi:hypothetical protein
MYTDYFTRYLANYHEEDKKPQPSKPIQTKPAESKPEPKPIEITIEKKPESNGNQPNSTFDWAGFPKHAKDLRARNETGKVH